MSREYWFARRFSATDRRKAMAPVHWKGHAVILAFVTGLTLGGVAFAWMGASGYLWQGLAVFAIAALVSGGWFIAVAQAKGDHRRTVADYRSGDAR